jgi:hypothetical protein
MKNSAQVLSHILNQPHYKKLAQHRCIDTIKALFPPHLQKMIQFAYIKQKVLYFVLNHPGAKQEFDIIIASIKTPLKLHPPQKCRELDFEDLRAYVSHKPLVKEVETRRESVPTYIEQSAGTFENPAEDAELHNIIEKIRKSIHDKHH